MTLIYLRKLFLSLDVSVELLAFIDRASLRGHSSEHYVTQMGVGVKFSGKSVTKVLGSMLLALRVGGLGPISRKNLNGPLVSYCYFVVNIVWFAARCNGDVAGKDYFMPSFL